MTQSLVFCSSPTKSPASAENKESLKIEATQPTLDFLKQKLVLAGVSSGFVDLALSHPHTKIDDGFIRINVTNFKMKVDYSPNYNWEGVARTRKFIARNRRLLKRAEDTFGVPKEIIAALLWVETKFGKNKGKRNVMSVYLSASLCDEPYYIEMNKVAIRENTESTPEEVQKLEAEIDRRSKRKAQWAIREILSLEKIYTEKKMNVFSIKGSWAGAFGMSQFLPTSFIRWATDGNHDGKVNLAQVGDAVFSVGNYLKSNGWDATPESQEKALFHYNNSKDYVNAIQTLAAKVRKKK